jgi:NAD(P)-dependent dehydrogenase (short-subunit alcohol dehydrogenase family)
MLEELADHLKRMSPRSETRVCDVGDADAYRRLLGDVERGHGRIDVLINNAGINEGTPVDKADLEAFHRLFDINFFGVVAGTLAVVPGMLQRRSGVVVNVSSDSARAPEPGQAAYAASKAAIAAFSESVAHEVADRGVHIHVLYPAWVPTAMGMDGIGPGDPLPPRPVRRTEEQVSKLLLERMAGPKMEINAAVLPLLAPIGRTFFPRSYQRAMRKFASGQR